MKKTIIFILLIAPLAGIANYKKATLYLTNNVVKEGYIDFPFKAVEKKIKYKDAEDSKSYKINTEEIERIVINTIHGNFTLVRTGNQVSWINLKKELVTKVYEKRGFLLLIDSCKNLSYYRSAHSFHYNEKKDNLILVISGQPGLVAFTYLLKFSNDKYPTLIGEDNHGALMIGMKKVIRNRARYFFKDYPKMVEFIDSEKYDGIIYNLYTSYCEMNN